MSIKITIQEQITLMDMMFSSTLNPDIPEKRLLQDEFNSVKCRLEVGKFHYDIFTKIELNRISQSLFKLN